MEWNWEVQRRVGKGKEREHEVEEVKEFTKLQNTARASMVRGAGVTVRRTRRRRGQRRCVKPRQDPTQSGEWENAGWDAQRAPLKKYIRGRPGSY